MNAPSSVQPLLSVLRRHPFTHVDLLTDLFGAGEFRRMIEAAGTSIQSVQVAGVGRCLVDKREPAASLLGIHRIALARSCARLIAGSHSLELGLSPGMEADLECYWEGRWWRFWVDMGVCAPEALSFIDVPPTRFGDGVCDAVITVSGAERLEQVTRLVARSWPAAAGEVLLMSAARNSTGREIKIEEQRSVRPHGQGRKSVWSVPNQAQVLSYLMARQSGSRHRSLLGELARQVDNLGWHLLVGVGSNPLLTPVELAVIGSPRQAEQAEIIRRITDLKRLELIENPATSDPRVTLEGRLALTWRGVELLAAHAGTTVETLRRRQPWPLRADPTKKGKTVYSLRWLRNHQEHQRWAQRFTLGLIEGARRVSRPTGGVEVELVTTIGGRLVYENRGALVGGPIRSVSPDAVCRAEFWGAPWLGGKVGWRRTLSRHTLLIEIDRGTMAVRRVAERLDRYAEVWPTMEDLRPALLWVVDGTPYRESQVLHMLGERELPAWTATLDRLTLPSDDEWWLNHPLAGIPVGDVLSGLAPAAFGGISPWRSIWRQPGIVRSVPLLDRRPWAVSGVQCGTVRSDGTPECGRGHGKGEARPDHQEGSSIHVT